MKAIEIVFALLAFVSGMLAAWFWLRASRVRTDPGWSKNGLIEPGIHSMTQDAWIVAIMQSAAESGRLNAIAARWTALTAILTALTTLVAFIA
jgi:hypothetical protein